jgi:DNA-binding CsgD family transcriptional regulator
VAQQWGALTEREREVQALVALGKNNEEIAQTLGVTTRT